MLYFFLFLFFFFNDTATTEIYTLSLHDALPIWRRIVPEGFCKNTFAFPLDDCSHTIDIRRPPSWAIPGLRRGRIGQHPSFRRRHLFTPRNQLIDNAGCDS